MRPASSSPRHVTAGRAARALAAVACLTSLSLTAPAAAFVVQRASSGIPLRWPVRLQPIRFVINQAGTPDTAGAIEAVRAGFRAWEVPASGLRFVDGGLTPQTRVDSDGVNLVVFLSTGLPADFAGGDALAIAGTIFDPTNGEILECDITFNNRDNRFTAGSTPGLVDVQSVATHEVGHLIGLDHSMVPTASMAPSLDVSAGELRRVLRADDVAGAAFLYPVPGIPPVVVTLQLNQATYRAGDTVILTAGAGNGATSPSPVDVYVSVRTAGGQALYLTGGSFSPQALPLATNLPLPAGRSVGPVEIVRINLPAGVPAGGYAWEAEFDQPGTRTPVASASAPFTVTGP